MVRNDDLALLQELVGDGDARVQQAAGIAAEVEDEALDVLLAETPEVLFELAAGVLAELEDLDVRDSGRTQVASGDTLPLDLLADDREG